MNKYDFIREMVPKHGCRWVAQALGATETDVRDACGYLGVKGYERPPEPASAPHGGKRGRNGGERSFRDMHHTYAAWTEGERELLRRDYPLHGSNIPELRERHTTAAIAAQAHELGVACRVPRGKAAQSWTEEEVATLRREYPTRGTNVPELLGRQTRDGIRQKARALGVQCYAH